MEENYNIETKETEIEKKSRKPYILISVLAVLLLCAGVWIGCKIAGDSNETEKKASNVSVDTRAGDADTAETVSPLAGRNISYAGIADSTISKGTVVQLENLPENEDIYMKYDIYVEDVESPIFSTELIPSGKSVAWQPTDTLGEGSYDLTFVETPYWMDGEEYVEMRAASNKVHFEVVRK